MPRKRHPAGEAAEALAARFLKKNGCKILQRNYATPAGEIDLIALDAGVVVFVEVRGRSSDEFGSPETSVNLAKQKRMGRVALDFCRRHNLHDAACRFDVVSVRNPGSARPAVEHFEDAFPLR
jgi:putative endonuclease